VSACSPLPHALLYAGAAAGTGKTSSARLLSRRAALPLVYVPLEGLVSKWYGESEQNMAKVRRGKQARTACRVMC
jgi:SpoVK/Ycf46/Vps4 family AAA+-type ATPase